MVGTENGWRKRLVAQLQGRATLYLIVGVVFLSIVGTLSTAFSKDATASSAGTMNTGVNAIVSRSKANDDPYVQLAADGPLCDFGVNASHSIASIASYDTSPLRIGWYLDYGASANPVEPNEADYTPLISIHQTGTDSYTYSPSGAALLASIAGNPGATWLIGNEPDSPLQNNLYPHVYAAAYHELYHLIKSVDLSAKIFAGSIVQATEVRLLYLDMVLDNYMAAYGERMPVDGWSIHGFILNEVEWVGCQENCWGAFMPPGVNLPYGEILTLNDHDRIDLFAERIIRFRQWMVHRGYRGLPLYLTEYGILMPPDYDFPSSRVNGYMNSSFDYLLNATDMALGDPNDEYHLVQKLSWYSASDYFYNGWLYDLVGLDTYVLSAMGLNYADYVAGIESEIDLYPSLISTDPTVPFSPVDPVTLTLSATIANSGNTATDTGSVTVRFFDGDPDNGGTQIGGDQSVSLRGCGDNETVSVVWPDVTPGAHRVFVVVDQHIGEIDKDNNSASRLVIVASDSVFLPLLNLSS